MAAVFGFADLYQTGSDAEHQVIERLWAGNQVERGGEGSALVKVGEPQLGSCKLPLNVSILLRKQNGNYSLIKSFSPGAIEIKAIKVTEQKTVLKRDRGR